MYRVLICAVVAFFVGSQAEAQTAKADGTSVEEIYIARSVREARLPPTEFCTKAKTGVDHAGAEDQFTFRSVALGSDGRVINANVETIGSAHTCVGPTAIPETSAILNFWVGY
jgi:hypothetical protein